MQSWAEDLGLGDQGPLPSNIPKDLMVDSLGRAASPTLLSIDRNWKTIIYLLVLECSNSVLQWSYLLVIYIYKSLLMQDIL